MNAKKHQPFVPESMHMTEFTARAVIIGICLTVVLGAANAYLGLRAGITIAATYPAAVIGMAALRLFKGSVLEENICRTAGSIGESVAAGAIFTVVFLAAAWVVPVMLASDAHLLAERAGPRARGVPRRLLHGVSGGRRAPGWRG